MVHTLWLLLQTAAPANLAGYVVPVALTVILGINAWQLRVTLQFRDESRSLRQWAYGENNDNGANGNIKDLQVRTQKLDEEIRTHSGRYELHELRLDGVNLRIDSVERRFGPADRREAS